METFYSTRFLRLRVFAALLGAATAFASSSHAETISLKEGYDRMLSSELELQGLGIEASIADEIVRQAKGQRYPRVTLNLKVTNVRQVVISSDNTTFQKADSVFPKGSATLTITQPLFDQARWRAMGLAEAKKAVSAAEAEVTRNTVTRQYVASFLNVATAQLQVQSARALVEARNQLKGALELQIESGRGNPLDLTSVEGDVFAAQSGLAEAEQRFSEAIFDLQRFVGPEVDAVQASSGSLAAVNAGNFDSTFSEDKLMSASLDVQLARAQVAVAEKEVLLANAALKPVVNLSLMASEEKTQGSLFGGGSDIATGEASLQMEWQVYEGGIRKSKLREQQKRVELAQLGVKQAEDLARRKLGALKEAIKRSKDREGNISAQAERAAQSASDTKTQEEAGKLGAEKTMEAELRARVLTLEQQMARLRTLQLESELLGLFGALDTSNLSSRLAG